MTATIGQSVSIGLCTQSARTAMTAILSLSWALFLIEAYASNIKPLWAQQPWSKRLLDPD